MWLFACVGVLVVDLEGVVEFFESRVLRCNVAALILEEQTNDGDVYCDTCPATFLLAYYCQGGHTGYSTICKPLSDKAWTSTPSDTRHQRYGP
jgi:hypothetical protein